MKKRVLCLSTALVLTLALLPTAALAEADYFVGDVHEMSVAYEGCTHDLTWEATFYQEACHDVLVTNFASHEDAQARSGPGWSYDPHSYTLTLNNFHGVALYLQGDNAGLLASGGKKTPTVTIRLVGENVITGNGKQQTAALHAKHANLVIQGPGSLTVSGERNGIFVEHNNGTYAEKNFDGGKITLKNGAKVSADKLLAGGGPLQADQLIVDAGCTMNLVSNSTMGSVVSNLVVNGTLIAKRTVPGNYGLAFSAGMYCTVGPNVTIRAGKTDADATTALTTFSPQTDPVYGDVTVLKYDRDQIYDYVEFREGGTGVTETPVTPAAPLAYARTQMITVNGKAVEFQAYALKDGKGDETNYVKLRDLAFVLNGSTSQFNVGWDGDIILDQGTAYVPNGTEMTTPFAGDRAYAMSTAVVKRPASNIPVDLAGIVLTDTAGAGYTYYKLRDLGLVLGFEVGWTAETGIFLDAPTYG